MELKLNHTTEFDKNIDTMSTTLAQCRFYRFKGICKQGSCSTCATQKMYDECYNAMTLCDRLEVENKASKKFYQLRHNYSAVMREQRLMGGFFFWVAIFVGFCLMASLR